MAKRVVETSAKNKPANYETEYDLNRIIELAKCKKDVIYFVETYCKIIHTKHGVVPFKLYEYQRRLLRAYAENDRVIAMLARQSGKSQTAAAFLLWFSIFHDAKHVLVASNKGRNSIEIMDRIKFMYEELPWWLKPGIELYNRLTIKFDNKSMIEAQATTPDTGRGLSIALLYSDELAKVAPNVQKAMITSLSPTLSNGGRWIITSTPNTDEDRFSHIWLNAEPLSYSDTWSYNAGVETIERTDTHYETKFETDKSKEIYQLTNLIGGPDSEEEVDRFKSFFAHWRTHPDRDEKFKIKQLNSGITYGEWQTEFECVFSGSDDALISPMALMRLSQQTKKPRGVDRYGGYWYERIKPNTAYAVVIDPSEGRGRDNSVIQVWEIPALVQVAEWASNTADQIEQTRMMIRYMKRIFDQQQANPNHTIGNEIYYSAECNGIGMGIISSIIMEGEEKFPGFLIDSSGNKSRGLRTTNTSKVQFCLQLKKLLERGLFVPSSKSLVSELKDFVKIGKGYEAKPGAKDDRVMSCVLMLHLLDELKYHVDGIESASHVQLAEHDPDDENDPQNQPLPPML